MSIATGLEKPFEIINPQVTFITLWQYTLLQEATIEYTMQSIGINQVLGAITWTFLI
jgi:hypothetical protein